MRTWAIITSRFNSTRLPGKALMDICGKPMIQRVVDRVREVEEIDDVVVATSTNSQPIIEYCLSKGIHFYAGSEDDQLERIYETAVKFKAEQIVRIWGDCPLVSPELIGECVSRLGENYCRFVYTVGFPKGLQVLAYKFLELEGAQEEMTKEERRIFNENEEVEWFKGKYNRCSVSSTISLSFLPCSVNTQEDMDYVRRIYESFNK